MGDAEHVMTTKQTSFTLPGGEYEIEFESLPDRVRVTLYLPGASMKLSAEIPTDEAERIGEALVKAARRSPR